MADVLVSEMQPTHPILITNSSQLRHLVSTESSPTDYCNVHIYPQNLYIPRIPNTPQGHNDFALQFLTPSERKGFYLALQRRYRNIKLENRSFDAQAAQGSLGIQKTVSYSEMDSPSIFVCGHESRDSRCGVMGPILHREFMECIDRENQKSGLPSMISLKRFARDRKISMLRAQHPLRRTTVSLISHIGGHAFAGNVIIYLPKDWKLWNENRRSPLAGKGIWYGRVEPKHVWGIVNETIQNGRLIEELLRGVHGTEKRQAVNEEKSVGQEEAVTTENVKT